MCEYYGYIYLTFNKVNGKIYFGQHKNPNFNPHYHGSGKLVSRAINKYGKENFKTYLVEWCKTLEQLCSREIYWIAKYQSLPKNNSGYNLAPGGEFGDVTYGMTERQYKEHCKKYSGSNNGMFGKDPWNKGKNIPNKIGKEVKIILEDNSQLFFNNKKECMNKLNINQKVFDRLVNTNIPYEVSKYVNKDKIRKDLLGIKIYFL